MREDGLRVHEDDTRTARVEVTAKEYAELLDRSWHWRKFKEVVGAANVTINEDNYPGYAWDKEALDEFIGDYLTERAVDIFLTNAVVAHQMVKDGRNFVNNGNFEQYNWDHDPRSVNLIEDSRTKSRWATFVALIARENEEAEEKEDKEDSEE